jgi:tetratricopeptide (TPR) repeat protein
MSVEFLRKAPPPRAYRFELLPEEAVASAIELLEQPLEVEEEDETGEVFRAVDRGLSQALAFAEAQSQERRAALIFFSELVPLPAAEIRERIETRRPRFRSTELLGLLYDKCIEQAHCDPRSAVELGEIAVVAAQNLDETFVKGAIQHDILAESLAIHADALRHAGDREAAEETFGEAERHLGAGSGTLLVRAKLLITKASLRCDQERYETGLRSVDQALIILRVGAEGSEIARALVAKGRLLGESGRPRPALSLFAEALELVDPSADRTLALAAQHNLAVAFWQLGLLDEARRSLAEAARAVRLLARPLGRLRVRRLQARIEHSEGDLEAAEAGLREVQAGFIDHDLGHEAATVERELNSWLAGACRQPGTETVSCRGVGDRSW